MTFQEWVNLRIEEGKAKNRSEVFDLVSMSSGVSVTTLAAIYSGMLLSRYSKAKALSEATAGAVEIEEIIRPNE